jgi:hypothetical protein
LKCLKRFKADKSGFELNQLLHVQDGHFGKIQKVDLARTFLGNKEQDHDHGLARLSKKVLVIFGKIDLDYG